MTEFNSDAATMGRLLAIECIVIALARLSPQADEIKTELAQLVQSLWSDLSAAGKSGDRNHYERAAQAHSGAQIVVSKLAQALGP